MSLTQPEQELRRDLQAIASDLRWSVVEIHALALRLAASGNAADAQMLTRICQVFESNEMRLKDYAIDIRAHKIQRAG